MGCTGSKQALHDLRYTIDPFPRSNSMPSYHSAKGRGVATSAGHHVVSLTSSTLGTIKLDRVDDNYYPDDDALPPPSDAEPMKKGLNDVRQEVSRAKTWSEMIVRKIPKTPTVTPPNEPETINTWELMAGLEDISPIRYPSSADRSFSFHATLDFLGEADHDRQKPANGFDPETLSAFRKTFEQLSPNHPFFLQSSETEKKLPTTATAMAAASPKEELLQPPRTSLVKARINAFQEKINAKRANVNGKANNNKVVVSAQSYKSPPGGEDKIVFYFTTLRGIRKTYEDCCDILIILKGYGVRIDERDISMHGGFKDELNDILGPGFGGCKLPRVFANGRYLGGAEEVSAMHEKAELGKALEGCEPLSVGKAGGPVPPCEACGDMRFVPCETCSGSCKIYVEEEEEVVEEEEGVEVGGFRRCSECNENGLVRCPICCGT